MAIDTDKPRSSCFHLRRIGKPASKAAVGNILKLYREITKFGRHSGNDHFIDSADLDCFISRWHSEIHRIFHKGKDHYILKDKSLNGTYVNNHRVQGDHVLQPGEVICFGHTNGKNLKPGEYAPQTDSEFEFVFEECLESDSDIEVTQIEQHVTGEYPSRPDVLSHTVTPGSVTDKAPSCVSTTATVDLLHTVPPHSPSEPPTKPAPQPRDAASPVLQDISNKSDLSPPGLVPLDQIMSGASHPHTTANINVQVASDKVFPPATAQPVSCEVDTATSPSHTGSTVTADREGLHDDQGASQFKIDSLHRPSFPVVRSDPPPEDHLHLARSPDHESGPEDHQSGPEDGQSGPPDRQPGPRDRPCASTASGSRHPGNKRKQKDSGNTAKKKRKVSGPKRPQQSSDSEDDDTWHYAGDKCDALTCNRPSGVKVSWVQCDDCDAWYHTVCAGCNYDKIKRKNAEFHCGCV